MIGIYLYMSGIYMHMSGMFDSNGPLKNFV